MHGRRRSTILFPRPPSTRALSGSRIRRCSAPEERVARRGHWRGFHRPHAGPVQLRHPRRLARGRYRALRPQVRARNASGGSEPLRSALELGSRLTIVRGEMQDVDLNSDPDAFENPVSEDTNEDKEPTADMRARLEKMRQDREDAL